MMNIIEFMQKLVEITNDEKIKWDGNSTFLMNGYVIFFKKYHIYLTHDMRNSKNEYRIKIFNSDDRISVIKKTVPYNENSDLLQVILTLESAIRHKEKEDKLLKIIMDNILGEVNDE